MEIFSVDAKDAVIRFNHYDILNGVQGFNWDPALNEDYKRELGNPAYAGQSITPEVTASMDFTATGATVAFLKRIIKTFSASEFTGYLAGDPATADNEGVIVELDLENAVADIAMLKKPEEVFSSAELLTRMYLASVSFSASVGGDASESYSFEGDIGEVFRAPQHDLVVLPLVRTATGTNTSLARDALAPVGYTIDTDGTDPDANWRLYEIDMEGERIPAADVTITINVGPDTIANTDDDVSELSVNGTTFAYRQGARLHAIVYRKTPGTFPTISYATAARFLESDSIDILLVDPDVTDIRNLVVDLGTHTLVDETTSGLTPITFNEADILLRIQSVDVSVDFQRDPLRQIKKTNTGTSIYHRKANYPVPVTVSLNALETDLSDWQKLQDKGANDVLDLAGFENKQWQIVIRYWYGDKVLQAIAVTDARVQGRGSSLQVQGRAEVSWGMTGSEWLVQGAELA